MSQLTSDKRYNSILKIIDEHLLPDIDAKKQRGEVFTPPELVQEMLFGLKKSALDKGEFKIWGLDDNGNFVDDKESDRIGGIPTKIWQNPTSTFLDPANGIGNFPIIALYKLDYELKKQPKFKDATKRKKHIIEKMLYMIELDKGNCQTCKAIFKKICPDAKSNICCKNTLTVTDKILEDTFGINRFDIIMGNPPYNKGGIRSKVGGKEGIETLWPSFIELSLKILNKKGLLILITPSTWIELKSPISKKMLEYQINYIHSYNVVDAHSLFSGQSGEIPLAYFQLENNNTKNDTYIYDKSQINFISFNIYSNNFIPSNGISIISKLLKLVKEYGNLSKYYENTQTKDKSVISDAFSEKYIYPLINISNKKINISYSSKCYKNNNNISKLVFSNFSMGYPLFDNSGILEPAANMMFVLNNDNINNLRNIQLLFYTNIIFFIINSLKTKQKFMSNRIFDILPDITNIKSFPKVINDNTLYSFLKFNKKDIETIENYKKSGEGRLTTNEIKYFIDFNINNFINKSNIKLIQNTIKDKCKVSTRKHKGGSYVKFNKTRKNKK
jgi:hypothetical protein